MITYVLDDIIRNRKRYLIFFIQMLAIFYLFNIVIPLFSNWIDYNKKYNEMADKFEVTYQISIPEAFIQSKGNSNMLKKYIEEVTVDKNLSFTAVNKFYNNIKNEKMLSGKNDIDARKIKVLKCTAYTQEFFQWECIKGRLLTVEDYDLKSEYIPVVVGYNWGNSYSVGEVIDEQYKVVGILKKQTSYLNILLGESISLDNYIVMPLDSVTDPESFQFFNGLYIVSDDKNLQKQILDKALELNFKENEIEIYNCYETFVDINKDTKQTMLIMLCIGIGLAYMAGVSIVAMLMQLVERRKREFAIHILCGGTKTTLYMRVLLQVLMVVVIACGIDALIFRELVSFLILLIFGVILSMIITLRPFIYIYKHSIADMIRRIV